jgi:hypothetical protein
MKTSRAEDSRRWKAWAGDLERLRRLVEVADGLIDSMRERANTELEEQLAVRITDEGLDDLEREQMRKYADDERKRHAAKWSPEMKTVERDLSFTRQGRPEAVLAAVDPAGIRSVRIEAPEEWMAPGRVIVELDREQGAYLRVAGEDPNWVRGAVGSLAAELERAVPRWAWIRGLPGGLIGAGVLLASIALALFPPLDSERLDGFIALAIFGSMFAFFLSWWALEKFLPGFEITSPGSRGSGSRFMAVLVSFAMSLLGGLLLNLLLG